MYKLDDKFVIYRLDSLNIVLARINHNEERGDKYVIEGYFHDVKSALKSYIQYQLYENDDKEREISEIIKRIDKLYDDFVTNFDLSKYETVDVNRYKPHLKKVKNYNHVLFFNGDLESRTTLHKNTNINTFVIFDDGKTDIDYCFNYINKYRENPTIYKYTYDGDDIYKITQMIIKYISHINDNTIIYIGQSKESTRHDNNDYLIRFLSRYLNTTTKDYQIKIKSDVINLSKNAMINFLKEIEEE